MAETSCRVTWMVCSLWDRRQADRGYIGRRQAKRRRLGGWRAEGLHFRPGEAACPAGRTEQHQVTVRDTGVGQDRARPDQSPAAVRHSWPRWRTMLDDRRRPANSDHAAERIGEIFRRSVGADANVYVAAGTGHGDQDDPRGAHRPVPADTSASDQPADDVGCWSSIRQHCTS